MNLHSDDFVNGDRLPDAHALDHDNKSPSLRWTDLPEGTVELAIINDDPDAPGMTWVHWVMYGLPASFEGIPQGLSRDETLTTLGGAKQGTNDFGRIGYDGPRPPRGPVHRYFFKLYALKESLNLQPGATKNELTAAMKDKILAEKEIIGLYSR
jgi:Raf kinase inhibitor-like YbhB/YbcL family protein